MAKKNSVYKKGENGSFDFWGYLPTEDVVGASEYTEKIADIITQLGGKANAFGVVGDGLSFNNNTITIDTDVMATREWVKAQGYSSDQIVSQQIEDIQHDVDSLSTRVSSTETSINTLNSAVADRYTKGEVDGELTNKAKTCNTKDIKYEEIAGNGTYIGSSNQGPYKVGVAVSHENIIYVQNTNYGGNYRWELSHDFWEDNGIHYRYKSEGAYSSWKTLIDSDNIGSQHVAEADHASVADTYTYGRGTLLTKAPSEYGSWVEAIFGSTGGQSQITEIRPQNNDWYTNDMGIMDAYSAGIAWRQQDTHGAISACYYDTNATICAGNGTGINWWRFIVLSPNGSNIANQTVKSFTATEIDHGDKFNGDLSSTTLVSSPLHMAVSEFNTSEANSPTAPRTLTGNIEVTFGSAKKTIANMKYNPFMAYFFDHGYHFSAVKEGGDSTLYDKGIVTYGQFIYYCVYAYHSDGSDSFDAAIIMTDDTTEMSKYVMYESGKAKDLMIEGNYIKTDGLKRVNIQEKAGTLALLSDIPSVPSVINNLASTSTSSALSAYQGKLLNDKISSLNSSIGSIKFSSSSTNVSIGDIGVSTPLSDEDLVYSSRLDSGTCGRFYVISGLESGYSSKYGRLVVKTSSSAKKDMTTSMVAGVTGEAGYWNPQWLSVSVFVPAGQSYYLWGVRMKNVRYSYTELNH